MANTITAPVPTRRLVRNHPAAQPFSRELQFGAAPNNNQSYVFDTYIGVVDRQQLNGPTAFNGNPITARTTYVGTYPGPWLDLYFLGASGGSLRVDEAIFAVGGSPSGTVNWQTTYLSSGPAGTVNIDRIRLSQSRCKIVINGPLAGGNVVFEATFRMEE